MTGVQKTVTKGEVETIVRTEVGAAVRTAVDDITEVIRDFASQVDERFNKNEAALFRIENRLDAIEGDIVDIKQSVNQLTITLDGFVNV